MFLTSRETHRVLQVLQSLSDEGQLDVRRAKAGRALLELFNADYFASFHWSEERQRFESPVSINMSDANLHRYEQYFQFRDPITRPMQRMRRAVGVNQIIEQRDFERTEFYNDFLRRDGLHFGVNLHVYDGDCPIADWRIWRSRRRENFDRRDLAILNMLAPHLRNVTLMEQLLTVRRSGPTACLSIAAIRDSTGLSEREAQTAYHALLGKSDRDIAISLALSLPTVRTHMRHIYSKLGVNNRSSLCRRLTRPESAPPTPVSGVNSS